MTTKIKNIIIILSILILIYYYNEETKYIKNQSDLIFNIGRNLNILFFFLSFFHLKDRDKLLNDNRLINYFQNFVLIIEY